MINIIYVALLTNRKDDIFMQRRLVQNVTFIFVGSKDLFIDEAHTALNIFRILPSPLCGIFLVTPPHIMLTTSLAQLA